MSESGIADDKDEKKTRNLAIFGFSGRLLTLKSTWCPEPDSNWHALRRRILNPLRLPIPPSGLRFVLPLAAFFPALELPT